MSNDKKEVALRIINADASEVETKVYRSGWKWRYEGYHPYFGFVEGDSYTKKSGKVLAISGIRIKARQYLHSIDRRSNEGQMEE